jgi:hypothetical protein
MPLAGGLYQSAHALLRILFAISALLSIGVALSPPRRGRVLGLLLAVPVGALFYFFLGIGIARALGVGRFYSVPLGAEQIADKDIVISLTFWIGSAGLIIWWLVRRGKRAA